VTEVDAATAVVVTVKVALVEPAATITLAGVAADVMFSESVICDPPAGAGPFSLTVPVDEVPPVTLVGLRLTELRTGGLIVSDACVLAPL
jgi:hypothetical protein